MTEIKIRRYTNLDELLSILNQNSITFYDQKMWEDQNDICYISKYKKLNHYRSVLVKCFAKAEETYLMWKAYTNKEKGVCIEFDQMRLINKISSKNIISRSVIYTTIKSRQSNRQKLGLLPFLKRYPYKGEKEYRIVYFSPDKYLSSASIPIDRSCILRILLSPWLTNTMVETQKDEIKKINGWNDLLVMKSSVLSNHEWMKEAENVY